MIPPRDDDYAILQSDCMRIIWPVTFEAKFCEV